MLRKTVLLAVLALALPITALANSIDFANQGGTVTGSNAGLTFSSTLIGAVNLGGSSFFGSNLGTLTLTTGALTSGSLGSGATFGGGTITIAGNGSNGIPTGTLFTGTFTSAKWTFEGTLANGTHQYLLTATLAGGVGFTFQSAVDTGKGFFSGTGTIESGDTNVVVPEPGTLSLLGTGLIGLAGVIRRKLNIS
ncbi:MAG: hypothetical protein DMG71_17115 [Acidobacteria bacterium]|nr:MAG: hypothetical protein DMG71_17115 [Acidobacteriota bacterium]